MADKDLEETYGLKRDQICEGNLVFYCRSGARSEQATAFAVGHGFKARNYRGSFMEWEAHGKPAAT